MHIVITGGAGFLGARLTRQLLAQGELSLAGATPQSIQSNPYKVSRWLTGQPRPLTWQPTSVFSLWWVT